MFMKILVNIEKCLILSESTKSKYYDNSNKLVAGKMKDKRSSAAIEEFVGLK